MASANFGYGVIFHMDQCIDDNKKLPAKHPNIKDVSSIGRHLRMYNINTDFKINFTLSDIKSEVEKLRNFDFSSYSCLVIVVVGHSLNLTRPMLMATDHPYEFFETIVNPIVNTNKTLTGKPKIFTILASYTGTASYLPLVPSIPDMFFSAFPYQIFEMNGGDLIMTDFFGAIRILGAREPIQEIVNHIREILIGLRKYEDQATICSTLKNPFFFGDIGKALLDVAGSSSSPDQVELQSLSGVNEELCKEGYALIIYQISDMMGGHTPNNIEMAKLIDTLQKCKTCVNYKKNSTLTELKLEIEKLKVFNFNPYECFMVIAVTPSENNDKPLLKATDQTYDFFETIINPILETNKTLNGKPKIITIVTSYSGSSSYIPVVPKIPNMSFTAFPYKVSTMEDGKLILKTFWSSIRFYGTTDSLEETIELVRCILDHTYKYEDKPTITTTMSKPFFYNDIGKVKPEKLKKGYCFMIYNNTCPEEKNSTESPNIKKYSQIKGLRAKYNIRFFIKSNYTLMELQQEVKKLRAYDFTPFDSFMVVVISHSCNSKKPMLMSRDEPYDFFDTIVNPIINTNKTLSGKPKIINIMTSYSGSIPYCPTIPKFKNMYVAVFPYKVYTLKGGEDLMEFYMGGLMTLGITDAIDEIMKLLLTVLTEDYEYAKEKPTFSSTLIKPFMFGDIGKSV